MNFIILFIAALVPLIVGFLWYNPKTFGTAWMKETGLTPEDGKKSNMPLIFGLTYLFSLMLAVFIQTIVIHQVHLRSLFFMQTIDDPSTEAGALYKSIMDTYGNSYRTIKHGAFHGTLAGLFLALPILGINALFEMRGAKYIAINAGYWIVSFALMGALVCAFL